MQTMNTALHGKVMPVQAAGTPRRVHCVGRPRTVAQAAATTNGASNGTVSNKTASENGLGYQIQETFPPGQVAPVSPEVQALLDEQGLDFETSGLAFLTNEARVRVCYLNLLLQYM